MSTSQPLPVNAHAGPSKLARDRSPSPPPHDVPPPIPPFLLPLLSRAHPSAPSTPSQLPLHPPLAPQPIYHPPPLPPALEEDLVPPENFAAVCPGVYRSGFPKKRNFRFMEGLGLRTVLTLVLESYPEGNLKWCEDRGVKFMQFGIPGNKEPFDNIPEEVICAALVQILDKRNHPILIHCNKGKHRTGCLIGCIRRLQSWSLTSIFDEYRRFSDPKARAVDQQFIDLFSLPPVWEQVCSADGGGLDRLPDWAMLNVPRSVGTLAQRKRTCAGDRSSAIDTTLETSVVEA